MRSVALLPYCRAVAWSVGDGEPRNSKLMEAVLLACGKSLHLANAFESKCKTLLRLSRLVEGVSNSPGVPVQDTVDGLPPDAMLAKTLQALSSHYRLHGLYQPGDADFVA